MEANLVAATLVIAAVGTGGCSFDWSWLNPDRQWMERVGYSSAPVQPAIEALRALSEHVAGLLRQSEGPLKSQVKLLDAPGEELRARTVKQVLEDEIEHATEHLGHVATIRRDHHL